MSSIPAMTEPDPCPFDQANLLTEEVVEPIDLDLLADCDDSEEERPPIKNNNLTNAVSHEPTKPEMAEPEPFG